MNHTAPARAATQRTSRLVVGALAVVIAATIGTLGLSSVSSSATTFGEVLRGAQHGALGRADGVVPDGTTAFDGDVPAIANLDPRLLGAVRRATTEAADDGVEIYVNSGWRSPKYQSQLIGEAVSKHGSREAAARWVASSDASPHVSGDAVDLGHSDAESWLTEHGAEYGLCQIYRNEPWHYELRPDAVDHGCPSMYADPTHDPRLQQ